MAGSMRSEVQGAPEVAPDHDAKRDIANVERVLSTDEKAEHMNYERIDGELANYANAVAVEISPEENQRLKKMIDKRVLPIMVFTYFLQALDKGTMSFASIMDLRDDIPVLQDNNKVAKSPGQPQRPILKLSSLRGSPPAYISLFLLSR